MRENIEEIFANLIHNNEGRTCTCVNKLIKNISYFSVIFVLLRTRIVKLDKLIFFFLLFKREKT